MSKKFLSPIKLAQGTSNPATGSAGELFFNTTDVKVYAHNGTTWVPSGGGVTVSATAPSTPIAGDAWYDTVDGTLYVYYNDGDSSQWVEVAANSGISVALAGRVGVVETYVTTLQSEMNAVEANITTLQTTGYRLVQTLYLTSSTTFTKATYPWLRAVKVKLVGGGGGGGATQAPPSGNNNSGNGGGGGCYAEAFITDISGMSSSVTVTVGSGGSGGSAATNNAAAGGTSSFGSFCSASGGSPGILGSNSSTVGMTYPNDSFTSRGGTSGVGDLILPGGQGGTGFMSGGSGNAMGGMGGSSVLAGSVATVGYPGSGAFARSGPNGQNYGGGGAGGSSLQLAGSTTGGTGAPGIVILELYA